MKNKILIIVSLFFTFISYSNAQPVIGFWEVRSVKVGDRLMTPLAKWFKINDNKTFQSGNGWTQNSYGTWTFDKNKSEYNPVNINGIKDEFGPFVVSVSGDTLKWERNEEGMKVIVLLTPINEMPIAPADEIQGLWQLTSAKKDNEDILSTFDPEQKHFIFIRPDKRYRLRNPNGQIDRGFWYNGWAQT